MIVDTDDEYFTQHEILGRNINDERIFIITPDNLMRLLNKLNLSGEYEE